MHRSCRPLLAALLLVAQPLACAQLNANSWWPKFQRDTANSGRVPVIAFAADVHVIWSCRVSAPIAFENHATPIFSPDNSRLYVGGPAAVLTAVNAAGGAVAWTLSLASGVNPGPILHTAALGADGSIYVGTWDATEPYDGFCKVRDLGDSAQLVWRFPLRRALASPTITPAGLIIVGGRHDTLGWGYFALRDLGDTVELAWSAARLADPGNPASTGRVGASPALAADGTLVFGGSDESRTFWQIEATTGVELERTLLAAYCWAPSPAVLPDGTVLIGEGQSFNQPNDETQGRLHAFSNPPASQPAASIPLRNGHLNGGIAAVRPRPDGTTRLYIHANGQGKPNAKLIAVTYTPAGANGDPPGPRLERAWERALGPSAASYPTAVVTLDGTVYALGPADHTLYAVRDAGAQPRDAWSLALAAISRVAGWTPLNQRGPQGVVVGPDATLYWNAPDGYLYALRGWPLGDLDGDEQLTAADLDWLQLALDAPDEYAIRFPEIDAVRIGDIDADGALTAADVAALAALIPDP